MQLKRVAPALFAVFVDILGFSLALPLLTAIFTTGDAHYAQLAIALSLYPFFMFFGSSFLGDLSDIVGRKRIITLCMGGFVIGFMMMGFGVNYPPLLYIGRSLTGLTAASLPTTLAVISESSTENKKATHMSYVVLVQSIGFVLGPLLAGVLSKFGFSAPFFAAAFLAFIAFLWVGLFFQESCRGSVKKKLHPLRIFLVFIEAARHGRIRTLTICFFLHQIGIGLYLQLILIFLSRRFGYTSFKMGLFNAFSGVWLALGLLLIPPLARRFKIEWIACAGLALLGLSELFTSLSHLEILIWVSAIFVAAFANIAWSTILTSFSNAVDVSSQGWAMGITGATVALTFMLTGFSPNLVSVFGVMPLIAFGGLCTLIASLNLRLYCRKYT